MTIGIDGFHRGSPYQPEARGPLGVQETVAPESPRVPAGARGPMGIHSDHMGAEIEEARHRLEVTARELKESRDEIQRAAIREIGRLMREQILGDAGADGSPSAALSAAVDRHVAEEMAKAIAEYFDPATEAVAEWRGLADAIPADAKSRHRDRLDAFLGAARRYLAATACLTDAPDVEPVPEAKRDLSDAWDWGQDMLRELAVVRSLAEDQDYEGLIQSIQGELLERAAWTAFYHYAEMLAAWRDDPTDERLNSLQEATALLEVVLKELHRAGDRGDTIARIGQRMQELAYQI